MSNEAEELLRFWLNKDLSRVDMIIDNNNLPVVGCDVEHRLEDLIMYLSGLVNEEGFVNYPELYLAENVVKFKGLS